MAAQRERERGGGEGGRDKRDRERDRERRAARHHAHAEPARARTVSPGFRRPLASASSTMRLPMRSLTLPPALKNSHLATSSHASPASRASELMRTWQRREEPEVGAQNVFREEVKWRPRALASHAKDASRSAACARTRATHHGRFADKVEDGRADLRAHGPHSRVRAHRRAGGRRLRSPRAFKRPVGAARAVADRRSRAHCRAAGGHRTDWRGRDSRVIKLRANCGCIIYDKRGRGAARR